MKAARVGILGLTFKENVPTRQSRVPDILAELREFGIDALVADPLADPAAAGREYGVELVPFKGLTELDGLVFAGPHRVYSEDGWERSFAALAPGGRWASPRRVPGMRSSGGAAADVRSDRTLRDALTCSRGILREDIHAALAQFSGQVSVHRALSSIGIGLPPRRPDGGQRRP